MAPCTYDLLIFFSTLSEESEISALAAPLRLAALAEDCELVSVAVYYVVVDC